MSTYTEEELQGILKQHQLWLSDDTKGERADLRDVNLVGVNLMYADLISAYLYDVDLTDADLTDADLTDADLSNANLTDANLRCTNLSDIKGKQIITFQANQHFAYYADGYIKIGCKLLSVEEWLEQYKQIGKDNSYSKEEIKLYGNWIKMINKNIKGE